MKLVEVKDHATEKAFLDLPVSIYQNNDYWIRPLTEDIKKVFDPTKNPAFQDGECVRWILQNDTGITIGRVAAFYRNSTKNVDNDQPTGGIGYFECIDDQKAAFMLFDACKEWLHAKGLEAMDGPINFGERDKFWGLLIKGYDKEPTYQMGYHLPYYKDFFEAYGFQIYFEQYSFYRLIGEMSENIHKKAERVMNSPKYSFRQIEKSNLEKYTEDFRTVYNGSFAKAEDLKELTKEESLKIMERMKPIIDERLISFAYYSDVPIGFGVFIPELNQLFKYVDGKMDLWGKLKFLYHRWRGRGKRVLGIAFGVNTRFHGRGIDAALIRCLYNESIKKDFLYYDIELNWIGDFNPTMIKIVEELEFTRHKTHATYRKLFDETKPFKRHPIRSYEKKAGSTSQAKA